MTSLKKSTYHNNAEALLAAIAEMVSLTPENDASIVNVEIAPQCGWQGETAEKEGTILLLVDTLSDGSQVYNLEIY